jgi:WD40 repeat protein
MNFGDVTFTGHTYVVQNLLSKKLREKRNKFIIAGCLSGLVSIYNVSTNTLLPQIQTTQKTPAYCIQIIDDDTFATQNNNHQIGIFSISQNKLEYNLQGHNGIVYAFELQDRTLFSGGYDSAVRVWDLTTRKQVYHYHFGSNIYALRLVSRNRLLIGGAKAAQKAPLHLINTVDGTLLERVEDHTDLIYQIKSTNKYIITAGFDSVVVRDHDLTEIRRISGGPQHSADVMEDDILALSHNGEELGLYDLNSGKCISKHKRDVARLVYYGVPRKLVIGTKDGKLLFYDVATRNAEEYDSVAGSMIRAIEAK